MAKMVADIANFLGSTKPDGVTPMSAPDYVINFHPESDVKAAAAVVTAQAQSDEKMMRDLLTMAHAHNIVYHAKQEQTRNLKKLGN
jgi:hypothetical protein